MASFRNALFLIAFVVDFVGVNSAAFQQNDYKQRPSVWSAKMSPLDMLSLWKKNGNVNTVGVNSAKDSCLPDVLTTTLYTVRTFDDGTIITPTMIAYRDQTNKRLAVDSTLGNITESVIILCGESGSTMYDFQRATQKCRKVQSPRCLLDPDPFCLPSEFSFVGSFRLGVEPGALNAQLWSDSSVDSGIVITAGVVFVPENGAPVAFIHDARSLEQQKGHSVQALFTDPEFSIPDPAVFTPPSYCNTGEEGEVLDHPEFDITALFERFASFR